VTQVVSSLMCLVLLASTVCSQTPATGGEAQVPSPPPPSAAELLDQGKFQEAYTAATTELNKKPTDFQMLFIAGAAACELKNYDDGIEYLLEAIRTYPNGIRGEYREKLEACVAKKQPPAANAPALKCETPTPPPYPAGQSFSWTHDDEGPDCNLKVKVALSFYANGTVQYARSKICNSDTSVADAKVYAGRWTATGNLVSMMFMVKGAPITLTGEVITKSNQKLFNTVGYSDLP